MNRFTLGLVAVLVGCNWVSEEDYQGRLDAMDNDGDGFDLGGIRGEPDCDDGNPNIYPGADDPWYDGIDSNCDGVNDWDKDGDGYVKENCEQYGCTGEPGDCNDENPDVNPAATEIWYDNIDGDCDDSDDFDADGDGSRIVTASGGQDCNDADPTIGPHATEIWYDGVDQDCDGANDYDQDNDLYVIAGCTDCSGPRGGDDCDDTVASVNPGAIETWYDDVDQNCDGLNDFDQDRDGYVLAGCDTADADCPGDLLEGDCDDDALLIYPGGREDVSDGSYDGDCDGGADSVALFDMGVTLSNPQNLRAAEYISNVYIIPAADQFTYSAFSLDIYDTAVAHPVGFVPPVSVDYVEDDLHPWPATWYADPPTSIAEGQQVYTVDMDSRTWFCGAFGGQTSSGRTLSIACYQLSEQGGGGPGSRRLLADSSSLTESFTDIGFAVDGDGSMHAFGCSSVGSGTLQYVVATEDDLASSFASSTGSWSGIYADHCSVRIADDGSGDGWLSYVDGNTGEHVLTSWDAEAAANTPFTGAFTDYFTEVYRGAPSGALDVEITPGDASALLNLLVTSTGGVELVVGDPNNGESYSAPIIARATQANLAWNEQRDRAYVAWADADGLAWLAWIDPFDANPSFEVAALNVDFSVEEVVPYYSSTQYLYLGAMGQTELAVVGVVAP
ncbi:MAG: putative metal-binding motif-containing protein [Alphaproteobacteria bacterium]|nr:putative metal-binding motif-containing protein [Alphaproteobacteria bacterium]MCB9792933.1 putative metal-binding motif-containing protein [Alphaproteobacteria bacterium]